MNNAERFKNIFAIYAEEFWGYPKEEMLDWLASDVPDTNWITMTFEELKAEAARQGYSLIKKQPYIALKKCPKCGKKPGLWVRDIDEIKYDCECVRIIEWKRTDRQARIAWNEAIERGKDAEVY